MPRRKGSRVTRVSLLLLISSVTSLVSPAEVTVRVRDGVVVRREIKDIVGSGAPAAGISEDSVSCGSTPRARDGDPVSGGGTLSPLAFVNPPTVNRSGRLAFMSRVAGADRNQGIFVADESGPKPVVMGCGGGGGSGNPGTNCGDPSPLGGRFSGLFDSTMFAPDINVNGDVLFLADVQGGSAPRGLFLYRAATLDVVKVAAVGDPSPLGGVFGAVGPGSLNDRGTVVFVASRPNQNTGDIFVWRAGAVAKVAAVGDPAPGGGQFLGLSLETVGFVDGTTMPTGPPPDLNNAEQIVFWAVMSGGIEGILSDTRGARSLYAKAGDPTPAGGTYLDFYAPILNESGQVAFFADFLPSPGSFSAGWFVGSPGGWRKALAFLDPLDGGQVNTFAVSRTPMQPLDDQGRLFLWCDLDPNGGLERLVIVDPDGTRTIAARRGEPTPLGGQLGALQGWPSLVNSRGTLSAGTPGAPGVNSAHFLVQAGVSDVTGLTVGHALPPGAIAVAWDSQSADAGGATQYQVVRGTLATLHGSGFPADAVCANDALTAPAYPEASAACPAGPGNGCWYLVRARKTCGTGSYGPIALDVSSPCP